MFAMILGRKEPAKFNTLRGKTARLLVLLGTLFATSATVNTLLILADGQLK